jgi:hypothetical protein
LLREIRIDSPPNKSRRLKPGKSRKVNVSVYPTSRRQELTEAQIAEIVEADTLVKPSNYYAQVYLVRRD